jgi:hypothetical protein
MQVQQHKSDAVSEALVQSQRFVQGARFKNLDCLAGGFCVGLHQRAQTQAHQVMVIHHQYAFGQRRVSGVLRQDSHGVGILGAKRCAVKLPKSCLLENRGMNWHPAPANYA